ncbi:SCO7613 C-terminal domain-containing membrane protein [Agromyces albus]|uniref:SCO7613 C-terminal domain-containing membrane protein n=1 Tax=Agromyces albus TaxID=205332 RepID=UPI0027D81315|nr:hypothetical protein [Agromyces albus]
MSDRPPAAPLRDLRRWPAEPAHLIDTTLCPACFSRLSSARCGACGLDLAAPEASELLAAGTRVYEDEGRRQQLITRMRTAQAARAEAAAAGMGATWAPAVTTAAPPAPAAMPAAAPAPAAAPVPAAVTVQAAATAPPAPAVGQPPAASVPGQGEARSGRSGVQVLLLTLGVVLISITAIVFLFVAYLVASLEVRSVIIAVASVLVLGVAWLLRARRLPGTAEGVASVAVVLLLLDVWIVRDQGLFGTDTIGAAGYTGGALLVVALLLSGVHAVSGIRVAGFAAAGLAPVGVFLLSFEAAPESEFATGVWLGCLAASLLGTAALLLPRSTERVILLSAGFAAGGLGLLPAAWALPELEWNELWTFLAVAAAWLLALVALHLRGAGMSRVWARIATPAFGAGLALAPAVSIAFELDSDLAIWLAPAAAVAVASLIAAGTRLTQPVSRDAFRACIAAAAVTFAAAIPGAFFGLIAVFTRFAASIPPWQLDADARIETIWPEYDSGAVLVPFVIAAGAFVVTWLMGHAHRLAAVPVGAALAGVLVTGALAPSTAVSAAVLLALAAGALALAATLRRFTVPGLLVTLLIVGGSGGALAWWVGYASVAIWPWAIAAVIAITIAGRVLAHRVWTADAAPRAGATLLAIAAALLAAALVSIPLWLDAAAAEFVAPWTSPWMWLATGGAVLLAGATLVRRGTPRDRLAVVVPLFAASVVALAALAFEPELDLRWLPALVFVVAGILWVRVGLSSAMRIAFAAATPLALSLASAAAVDEVFGPEFAGVGVAGATLLSAALAHSAPPAHIRNLRFAWSAAVGLAGVTALLMAATGTFANDELWLVLLLLTPVPIVMAALYGDPVGGEQPSRHLAWLSLALGVAAVWAWLAGDGVDNVEAYTLPLAAALGMAGGLITWRRATDDSRTSGRTALFGTAAAIAVLPSVGSSGDSELRTLALVSIGIVVAVAAAFLPESARGVPVRLLGVVAGWTAVTGAALVRGSAIATGADDSVLFVEFWPLVALAAGATIAVTWTRVESRPAWIAEALLAASVALAAVPTVLAIVSGEQPTLRAAVLFPLLALAHIAATATTARPIAGPTFSWATIGVLALGGLAVLVAGEVDPFDLVTASVGVALIGAGWFRMRRSPEVGSWPALGIGLALLLIPSLVADFTDPELWRNVALGIVAALVVLVGAMRRLQAPLLLGGGVLLVHAIVQLWPWITDLYEAVWWWLWLGIAGMLFVVLAATYERQLRLARGTIRLIAELR